jgi:hypothetical protein
VDLVLVEVVDRHGPEGVEADVERDALDVQLGQELRSEMEAGSRRRGRAFALRVDRLVALGIIERLGDVRRKRRLAGRIARQP